MQQVSTSLTLFLKIALPIIWTVFFLTFNMAVWKLDIANFGPIPIENFRIGLLFFLLLGIALLYWSVMRIKRVEMDKEYVYATNYFKNYRYPWHNIEGIEERDFKLFRSIHIKLKEPGKFGKKITFVASRRKFNSFIKENPNLFERFA